MLGCGLTIPQRAVHGVPSTGSPPAAPFLAALTGSFALAENAAALAAAGSVSGRTAGSTLTLIDDAGGRVALSGTQIQRGSTALDYETSTSHSFTVRETLAGASNSPRDTVLTLAVTNVFEAASLGPLTLSASQIQEGSAQGTAVGTVGGTTSGSTLTLANNAGGRFQLSGTALQAGATATDYASATSHTVTLRETLADSANSPRDTSFVISVTEASEEEEPTVKRTVVGSGSPSSNTLNATTAGTWYGVIGGSNAIVTSSGTKFTDESCAARRWRAGVLREGATLITQQTRTGASSWLTRINGADGEVLVANPGGAIPTGSSVVYADATNIDAVADGDLVNNAIRFAASSGFVVNPFIGFVFETEGDEYESWLAFASPTPVVYNTGALRYLGLSGSGSQGTVSFAAATPAAGTFDRLQMAVTTAVSANKVYALNIGGAAGEQLVSMPTAGLIEDATNIDAVALGDAVIGQIVGTGGSHQYTGGAVRFRSEQAASFVLAQGFTNGQGGNAVSPGNFWSGFNYMRRNNVDGEARNAIMAAGTSSQVALTVRANTNAEAITFSTRRSGTNLNGVVAIPALTAGIFTDATNLDAFVPGENINHTSPLIQASGTLFDSFSYRYEVAQ